LLCPIEAKGSLETMNCLSQRLNEIMTYGVNSGLIFANPFSGIRAAFKKPKKENMAALPPEELPRAHAGDRERQKETELLPSSVGAALRKVNRAHA
jgi:hypothetical protein